MKNENKRSICILVISLLVPAIFCQLFMYENRHIKNITLDKAVEINDILDYEIEEADIRGENVYIKGWIVENGNSIIMTDRAFFLFSENHVYQMNTIMQKRSDITEKQNNGSNYDNSGLEGGGRASDIENGRYRIGILLREGGPERYYLTDSYLEVQDEKSHT